MPINLNESILVLIGAWLFKEIYSTFVKRDAENRERVDAAIKAYSGALSSISADFKCINPQLLWQAVMYLPRDLVSEFKDNIATEDMIKIRKVLEQQILNLKEMQYDKVSASVSFLDGIKAPFKRTPIPNIIFTSLFFLIPIIIIAQIDINLKKEFSTIDLKQEEQMVALLNHISGITINILSILVSCYVLDKIPKFNKIPTNKKGIFGNIIKLIGVMLFVCIAVISLSLLFRLDISSYFMKSSICLLISSPIMLILMIKDMCDEFKLNRKKFTRLFKISK